VISAGPLQSSSQISWWFKGDGNGNNWSLCAFAAVSGSSMATAATMSTVALPEMKRYNYDRVWLPELWLLVVQLAF
jgi:TRAP-type C4-dicarboxylate transport system permease large subunit